MTPAVPGHAGQAAAPGLPGDEFVIAGPQQGKSAPWTSVLAVGFAGGVR